jgi:hypothetical protein
MKNNKSRRSISGAFSLMVLLAGGVFARADAGTEALLDKLVQKGILTTEEADGLRAEGKSRPASRLSLPEWIQSVKFGGDFRLRYDNIQSDFPSYSDRGRFRYRLRFGVTFRLNHDLETGLRLASGSSGDPISNNQTFRNNGTPKGIYINQAYLKWAPLHTGGWRGYLLGGKMKNPVTAPSTLLFDHDYTPEGFAEYLAWDINDDHRLSLLLTQFVLDDLRTSGDDPCLFGGQLRWEGRWSRRVRLALGASGFGITHPETLTPSAVPYVGRGNTRDATGALVNDYTVLAGDVGLTYTFDSAPLYRGPFPVLLLGSVAHNLGADEDNLGWVAGFRLGKARRRGQWEFNYQWRYVEADYWWDQVVESDFGAVRFPKRPGDPVGYFSGTNLRGHWFKGTYAIFDQWSVSVAYFLTEEINTPASGGDHSTGRLFVETSVKY